ncbi:hypothetical protein [Rhodanobacter aciditrophus]|uniref:hypothetical protein n=1 Tax=Rhodanobacter aciditrophus TaxID=1623218 RepID=UPI003CF8AC53
MELDEMKLAWQALGRQLERQNALNQQLFRDSRMGKLRRGLRPLIWGQALQMTIGVLLVVVAAAFWAGHRDVARLVVCGLLVHAYGLLLIAFAARVLYLVQRIDPAAPVVAIQRQLADLRAWRVRVEAPVNLVLGCFVWIPVLWMNLAWYGVDLWSPGFMSWAVSSGLAGLAACMLVVWLMRRAGLARRVEDSSAGRSVQKAEAVLEEIARFERE